jgi:hypothetical protein
VKCEVEKTRDECVKLSEDMTKSLRKLRIALRNCDQCEKFDDCPILKDLNIHINAALEEVLQEWGL